MTSRNQWTLCCTRWQNIRATCHNVRARDPAWRRSGLQSPRGCSTNLYVLASLEYAPLLKTRGAQLPEQQNPRVLRSSRPRATPRQRSAPFVKPPTTSGQAPAAHEHCRGRPTTSRACGANADEMPTKRYEGAEAYVTIRTGAFSAPTCSRLQCSSFPRRDADIPHVAKGKRFV